MSRAFDGIAERTNNVLVGGQVFGLVKVLSKCLASDSHDVSIHEAFSQEELENS